MIRHNLKTALRNLWKYKLQTLISIVSLAVGLVAVAAAHTIMRNFAPPPICQEPYYERCYQITSDYRSEKDRSGIEVPLFKEALTKNGGLRCAEGIYYFRLAHHQPIIVFHMQDSTEKRLSTAFFGYVNDGYLHCRGIRSAITGEKIPVLKKGEAVISQECAKKVFGKENPIGTIFHPSDEHQYLVIRDVFAPSPMDNFGFALYINDEGLDEEHFISLNPKGTFWGMIVLREGYTQEQLEKELKERLEPLSIRMEVKRLKDAIQEDIRLHSVLKMRVILYLIGGMLLLAAVIGFLRMQVQLYWMRRRELLLRMTNGATWGRLYGMLLTETGLMVGCSFLLAVWLYGWLTAFLVSHPSILLLISDYEVSNFIAFWYDIPCISLLLFIVCAVVTGIALLRICRYKQSFSAGMQQSHNHVFRNVMIGIQLTICMLFVCGTLELSQVSKAIRQLRSIPRNENFYKKCLYVSGGSFNVDDKANFSAGLRKISEVGQFIPYNQAYVEVEELNNWAKDLPEGGPRDPRLVGNVSTYTTQDTAFQAFFQMPVHWLHGDADRSHYVLLSDSLMKELEEIGICQDGTLKTVEYLYDNQEGWHFAETVYPIAGTVSRIPYRGEKWSSRFMIRVDKNIDGWNEAIIVPKKGEYQRLKDKTEELMQTLHPEDVEIPISNFRNFWAKGIDSFETIETGVHILCIVCLIICGMSIYSSISLDTRTRRKEMAIRKVNGAQRGDIALLFGRLYIVLLAVGTLVTVPTALLLNDTVFTNMVENVPSPVLPILCGSLLTYLLVLCIVGWHILHIARVNPVEYIAKE